MTRSSMKFLPLALAMPLLLTVSPPGLAQIRTAEDMANTRQQELGALVDQPSAAALGATNSSLAARSDTRVIGGEDAYLTGQWEFTVNLVIENRYRCGGVLLSPDIRGGGENRRVAAWRSGSSRDLWILTAAHCVKDQQENTYAPEQIQTRAGIRDLSSATEPARYKITQIIPHPGYDPEGNFRNDIALLRLEQPTNTPQGAATPKSITLPTLRDYLTLYQPGVRHQVNGWGVTGDGNVTDYLQTAAIPYLDQDECFEKYLSLYGGLPEGAFCAGWIEGGIDSCGGDSGGPIFFTGDTGVAPYSNQPILTGVVSWGRGCAQPGFPGIYTMAFYFSTWLEKTVIADF